MDPVEIKCIVRGILATASLETDQAERDVRCLRAIMKEPIASLICISTDAAVLIDDLIETCYEHSIRRLLAAAKHVKPQNGSNFQYGSQMHAQLYEISLRRLQQIESPKFEDLETACTIYRCINADKCGSARSLVRKFVTLIGACRAIDTFIDSDDTTPDIQVIIASALIESSGAYEIWKYLRPAFREGYKDFDAWRGAETIKAQIEALVFLEPTSQIIDTMRDLVSQLNKLYQDPFGGERWVKEYNTERAKWWAEHVG